MNKEQLLATLKGLTEALEAPTTNNDKPSNEVLIQAYCAGMRFVLDDMRHEKASIEFTVSGEAEDGSNDSVTITGDKELLEAFFEEKSIGGWGDNHDVKCEKYVEQFDEFSILRDLAALGLCDQPVRPDTEDNTTNTTDNA